MDRSPRNDPFATLRSPAAPRADVARAPMPRVRTIRSRAMDFGLLYAAVMVTRLSTPDASALGNLRRLLRCTAGANVVEYAVMLGLVALVGVVGFRQFGGAVGSTTETYAGCIKMDGSGKCVGGGSAGAAGAPGGAESCPGGVCLRPDLGQCFVAGTKVATPSGERSIEEIQTGDTVYSRDDQTGTFVVKQVGQTFVTPNMPLVDVHVYGVADDIVATRGHPFFTLDRGWVEAQALEPGEPLADVDGREIYVDFVERLTTRATVYNFEVEDTHTYFVGAAHAWVHNPLVNCNGNQGSVVSTNSGTTTIVQLSPDPKQETTLSDSVSTYGKLNPGSNVIQYSDLKPGSLANSDTVMVITHGAPGSLSYGPNGSMNGNQLGDALNNAGFDGKKPGAEVHVLACNSGTTSIGGHCVAQAVANTTGATTTGAVANNRPGAIFNQYTGGVFEKPFPGLSTGQASTSGGKLTVGDPGPNDVTIPFNGVNYNHGPPIETVDNGTMQEFKPKPPKKKKTPKLKK